MQQLCSQRGSENGFASGKREEAGSGGGGSGGALVVAALTGSAVVPLSPPGLGSLSSVFDHTVVQWRQRRAVVDSAADAWLVPFLGHAPLFSGAFVYRWTPCCIFSCAPLRRCRQDDRLDRSVSPPPPPAAAAEAAMVVADPSSPLSPPPPPPPLR